MNYAESVRFIHSRLKFGSRPGLDNIRRITSLLGNPQSSGMRFVHIAGTNGKGSISTMLSNMLIKAGFKTGLYISPYVVNFRERFQINGEMISAKGFAKLASRVKPLVEQLDLEGVCLTEFEIITAIAFLYFKESGCDYVVLEVGMGGRFDATNIIESPDCSVIAHIDLDHTAVLGETYEQIAYEKCGIIKSGCPVVSYPEQPDGAKAVIEKTALKKGCALYIPQVPNADFAINKSTFTFEGEDYELKLIGEHQIKNSVTAIKAAKVLGIQPDDICVALKSTQFFARFEVISEKPLLILDGAHNPDGMTALADNIKRYCDKKPTLVIGMLKDKEFESALSIVAPLCENIITLKVPNPRTLTAAQLGKSARKFCKNVWCARGYESALNMAYEKSNGAPIIVAGSLYLASVIRPKLLSFDKIQ